MNKRKTALFNPGLLQKTNLPIMHKVTIIYVPRGKSSTKWKIIKKLEMPMSGISSNTNVNRVKNAGTKRIVYNPRPAIERSRDIRITTLIVWRWIKS